MSTPVQPHLHQLIYHHQHCIHTIHSSLYTLIPLPYHTHLVDCNMIDDTIQQYIQVQVTNNATAIQSISTQLFRILLHEINKCNSIVQQYITHAHSQHNTNIDTVGSNIQVVLDELHQYSDLMKYCLYNVCVIILYCNVFLLINNNSPLVQQQLYEFISTVRLQYFVQHGINTIQSLYIQRKYHHTSSLHSCNQCEQEHISLIQFATCQHQLCIVCMVECYQHVTYQCIICHTNHSFDIDELKIIGCTIPHPYTNQSVQSATNSFQSIRPNPSIKVEQIESVSTASSLSQPINPVDTVDVLNDTNSDISDTSTQSDRPPPAPGAADHKQSNRHTHQPNKNKNKHTNYTSEHEPAAATPTPNSDIQIDLNNPAHPAIEHNIKLVKRLIPLIDEPSATLRGYSCHQCKCTKSLHQLLFCTNKSSSRVRKLCCKKKYCISCLNRSYDVDIQYMSAQQASKYMCPACLHVCKCAACQRKDNNNEDIVSDNNDTISTKSIKHERSCTIISDERNNGHFHHNIIPQHNNTTTQLPEPIYLQHPSSYHNPQLQLQPAPNNDTEQNNAEILLSMILSNTELVCNISENMFGYSTDNVYSLLNALSATEAQINQQTNNQTQ